MTAASPVADGAIRSLYLHVPFCERRCEYCDFASVAGLGGEVAYLAALRSELRAIAAALPGTTLDTVFVGGGTPGLIPPEHLAGLLDEVRAGFRLAAGAEVTIEANPSSTDAARAEAWLRAGVTRVSVGVQSLDPATLRFLGRVHDPAEALAALDAVRRAGFVRVNADLIYGVPGLRDAAWLRTLEAVLERDPGHLSAYELTIEEGTPLGRSVAAGRVVAVDAETSLRQHWLAVDAGAAAGYVQYEVSNLARPGQECRHNLACWANAVYLAAGVGAHGHIPAAAAVALGIASAEALAGAVAVRYWHPRSPLGYRRRVAAGAPVEGFEAVDVAAAGAERLMVGLRLARGVELAAAPVREEAAGLAAAGLLEWDGSRARATRRGQEVLNAVALRLVAAAG